MNLDEFILKALCVKFKDKGRDYLGWDCYGLLVKVYQDVLYIELPSFKDNYVDAGDTKASRRVINDLVVHQKRNWLKIKDPQVFDVVLFRFGEAQTHVGLVIDKDRFLHCEKKINMVIERLDCMKWKKRIEGFYRLKDK